MDAAPALYHWQTTVQEQSEARTMVERGRKLDGSALDLPDEVAAAGAAGFLPVASDIAGALLANETLTAVAIEIAAADGAARGIPQLSPRGVSWSNLSTDAQARLLAADPATVGNLAGVPVAIRTDAHRENARVALGSPDTPAADLLYLAQVADGERTLLTFDPANDRIIEVIGTITSRTSTLIIYVPGSDADFAAFTSGEIQGVAEHLVRSDRSGETVALVVKDGAWANWDQLGGRSNYDPTFADETGSKLAQLVETVSADPVLGAAKKIAIGHSWGMSALSNAETKGAHFDEMYSLAGGWLDAEWSANASCEYMHLQYGVDAINYFELTGRFPHELSAFDKRVLEPEFMHLLGRDLQNEPFNHGRISVGAELNRPALDVIFANMHDGRAPLALATGRGR